MVSSQESVIRKMSIKGHRDLVAWQKGMQLVKDIDRVTRDFPREEIYGLTSQLRRPQSLCQAISRRDMDGIRERSFTSSLAMPADHYWKSRRDSRLPATLAICRFPPPLIYWQKPANWGVS